MNKKQTIVAWVFGILMSLTVIIIVSSNFDYKSGVDIFFITLVVLIPFLLIGVLLIHLFRNRLIERAVENQKELLSVVPPVQKNENIELVDEIELKDELLKKVINTADFMEYYNTSLRKLVLLSIFTFSIYGIYWMYKNWKAIKEKSGVDISPFWRAWLYMFFCYHLFKIIKISINQKSFKIPYSAGILATVYILATVCGYISAKYNHWSSYLLFFISFIDMIPLIILQKTINSYNMSINQSYEINSKFTKGPIIFIVLGGMFLPN